ncbi:MAG: hypothetical protein J5695_01790 [Bacteroidales bacterium]|nr:hypothetical protein [Bacteroidales bacterium]
MKTRLLAAACAALAIFTACEGLFDFDDTFFEDDTTVPILDGNTLTYGEHQYTLEEKFVGDVPTGTITFTHFPATLREFKTLQTQLLGSSQPGTLALNLMAFEMFRRDRTVGQKCIEACNLSVNAKSVINNLKEKFPLQRGPETDSYQQSYLVATFLAGATQENKYQPEYPYKFEFTYNTSNYKQQGEYSYSFFGKIYHWVTTRGGNKDYDATVIVLDEDLDDDGGIRVHGCSNYYLAAPTISGWNDTLK